MVFILQQLWDDCTKKRVLHSMRGLALLQLRCTQVLDQMLSPGSVHRQPIKMETQLRYNYHAPATPQLTTKSQLIQLAAKT